MQESGLGGVGLLGEHSAVFIFVFVFLFVFVFVLVIRVCMDCLARVDWGGLSRQSNQNRKTWDLALDLWTACSPSANQPPYPAFQQLLIVKADLSWLQDLRWLWPKVALSYITTCFRCLRGRQGARDGFHGRPTPGSCQHLCLPSSGEWRNYRLKEN